MAHAGGSSFGPAWPLLPDGSAFGSGWPVSADDSSFRPAAKTLLPDTSSSSASALPRPFGSGFSWPTFATAYPVFAPTPPPAVASPFASFEEEDPVFLQYAVDANGLEVRTQDDVALAYFEKRDGKEPAPAPALKELEQVPTPAPQVEAEPAWPIMCAGERYNFNSEGGQGVETSGDIEKEKTEDVKIDENVMSEEEASRFYKAMQNLQNLPPHRNLQRYFEKVQPKRVPEAKALDWCLYQSRDFEGTDDSVKYRLISWLLDGLVHLHSNDFTHGDLTSKNVLVAQEGTGLVPLLTHFGLASLRITTVSPEIKAEDLRFDPAYASPELLRGEIKYDDVDAWKKSDVYSVTVLIAELLLERTPWEGELPVNFTKAVRKQGERPFNLDEVRIYGHKYPWLEEIIAEGWHQDASQRPDADRFKTTVVSGLNYCMHVGRFVAAPNAEFSR